MFGRRILSLRPHSSGRWRAKVRLPVVSEGQLPLWPQVCVGSRFAGSAYEHGPQKQASCPAWSAPAARPQPATNGGRHCRCSAFAAPFDAASDAAKTGSDAQHGAASGVGATFPTSRSWAVAGTARITAPSFSISGNAFSKHAYAESSHSAGSYPTTRA